MANNLACPLSLNICLHLFFYQKEGKYSMLSSEPIDLKKVSKDNIDREICRLGMIAELDAVSLYEQLAASTGNKALKTILLDIAKEEKTHMAEFETLLLRFDKEQVKENINGKKEVEEKT